MPRETFLNLPRDKQQRITDLALEEFAAHNYKTASLTRIVQKAGIAKGSMYQYFENKKDLYLYLVEQAADTKFNYINSMVDPQISDFFSLYKQMLTAGAMFDIQQPKYSRLLLNVTYENHEPDIMDISENLRNISFEFIRKVVFQGQVDGCLRRDIDTDFLVFVIYTMSVELESYFKTFHHFSIKESVAAGQPLPIDTTQLKTIVDQLIDLLAEGLGDRSVQ